jgi:hypothetical protein
MLCCLCAIGLGLTGHAAELKECVKLAVQRSGVASLTNGCSQRLNVTHCVDHSDGAKSGSQPPLGVVTLFPGSSDVIAGYASHGSGAVYWAVCLYPEAPVDWKPGPDSPYLCNKTCVMC